MDQLITQVLVTAKGVWKYRWYSIVVAWLVAIGGFAAVLSFPDHYQASARVFVDTQSILKPILAGMTTIPDVEQQVSIMSKTLLSRPNMERVTRMVDLDITATSVKEKEALIDSLTKEIKISGTPSNNIYTITYDSGDPKLATNVVQSLLTLFIEGSFGDKKKDTANAVRFIDEQIKQYEEKLIATENAIAEFKQRNGRVATGQEGAFSGKVAQMEEQLSQARLELTEAEQARNAIKRELAGEQPYLPGTTIAAAAPPVNSELDERLRALQKTLDTYRLQYTDQHPDVVATSRLIAQLEARKAEEAKNPPAVTAGEASKNINPVMQQLRVALSDAEAKVASMRARVQEYSNRAASLRSQAAEVPELEAQFAQLNRDYQVNKQNYEKLIASRDAARLSGDISATAEMVSFRIIDPPTVPVKPVGPNRPRLLSIVFVLALGAGLGIGFLMSQIRPSFVNVSQLRESSRLPILGSVSMNWTQKEKTRRRRSLLAFSGALACMIAMYGGLISMQLLRG